jgi:hypothetical protein
MQRELVKQDPKVALANGRSGTRIGVHRSLVVDLYRHVRRSPCVVHQQQPAAAELVGAVKEVAETLEQKPAGTGRSTR